MLLVYIQVSVSLLPQLAAQLNPNFGLKATTVFAYSSSTTTTTSTTTTKDKLSYNFLSNHWVYLNQIWNLS